MNGFLPGSLWYQYQLTGDAASRDSARVRQATFESHATRTNNHDLGFLFMSSYGNAYRMTGDRRARETLLNAASSLAQRYDPRVGMVRSTNTREDFRVIIDTTMNLELLFWGARNGGNPEWRQMATSHALGAARDFMRFDGSTFHYVGYRESDGAVLRKGQVQGYSAQSTWSRGQAWMIHGMGIAYREAGDPRFLDAARRATRYWSENVPDDYVPYWDFRAPGIPDEPRDSSAAAIAASAFVELSRLDPDPRWRRTYADLAEATLESLSSPDYLAEGIRLPAVLKHGTYAATIGMADHGTSWGDYYFREGLMRYGTAVERIGGPDRYHTSARTSSSVFSTAPVAVVASGESFPDALSASSLAGTLGAPLLLTGAQGLPGTVRSELARLKVSQVVIVGGTAAVSTTVQSAIGRLPGVRVTRVSGADRFATAVKVADRVSPGSKQAPIVFIARGDDFADALAAAPVAYAQGAPILLTPSGRLHPATAQAVTSLRPERIVVLGGEASLSPGIVRGLQTANPSSAVTRIGGQDRYDTAARFARWAQSSATFRVTRAVTT